MVAQFGTGGLQVEGVRKGRRDLKHTREEEKKSL
jgi:hypothetical protein